MNFALYNCPAGINNRSGIRDFIERLLDEFEKKANSRHEAVASRMSLMSRLVESFRLAKGGNWRKMRNAGMSPSRSRLQTVRHRGGPEALHR
jgi:hypothetical protein